ncbi:MAG: hypothetical protein O3B13_09920 [Planctomycetota bacterium]|nr:hypothetical protein [Planctomycetota bacterium]MDA1163407.1 hypothetical protein [Planctomycetota bacterium]
MRPRLTACILAALFCATSGCNYIVLLGYLIGGPPSIEPDYDAMTGNSMTDSGIVVAVVCFAPKEVMYSFAHVDRDIAVAVARRLHNHKIAVINPDMVQKWIDENPNWDEPDEIGSAVGATHVVYIDLTSFTLYEENSHELYRGRSEGVISVYELDEDGDGEQTYSKELISRYPLAAPRDSSDISRPQFHLQYLARVSEEVGRLFYEHYNGDDMSDAT